MFDLTVGDTLRKGVHDYPRRVATWYDGRAQTFEEFSRDVDTYCTYLTGSGLAPGDRVAVLSRNNPEMLKLMFASALGGYVFVPINFRISVDKVAFVIRDSGATAFFMDRSFVANAQQAVANMPDRACRLVELGSLQADAPNRSVPPPAVRGQDPFGIFYTSGTTGDPKGVVLTHENMMAGVINHIAAYGLGQNDVCLHIMPFYHTMEASLALCQFFVGGTNVIEDHFDGTRFWPLVDRYGVTHVTAVFTVLSEIIDCAPEPASASGRSLKTISLGGQAVPTELMRRAVARLGNDRLIQVYGLTEASPLITYLSREEIRDDAEHQERLLSVGKDLLLTTTRVVDNEGHDVAPGTLGEIIVSGPNVMSRYWKRDVETRTTLRNGRLHTGDIGRYDKDGFLYIVDRKKDLIISGGENIAPREVEEALMQHPAVKECSVFAIPDSHWGEVAGAAVCVREAVSESDLMNHCARSLGKFKAPRSVWFVDELPRDPVGKIQKKLLRERYGRAASRHSTPA